MRHIHSRRGVSLLEVTIGSLMAAIIAVTASGVAYDVSRHMASNIAETQLASEARLAIESFRRDFGGTLPDDRSGHKNQWRLVGRMIPASDELRLCFDSGRDASADWIAPDRVITYWQQDNRLLRSDAISGNTFTVARFVDTVSFALDAGQIVITIDFAFRDAAESYTFVTADVP